MKWNAFDFLSPAIEKTKQRLFPFNFKEWFKLMIICTLSGTGGSRFSGGNSLGSGNSFSGNGSGGKSDSFSSITGNAVNDGNSSIASSLGGIESQGSISESIRAGIKEYWVLGSILFFIGFLFMTFIGYIRSVFAFIFIEALINKESKFTFKKNNPKGISLFVFRFIVTMITLIIIVSLAAPYIYHFIKGNNILEVLGWVYIAFSIIAFIIYIIILWLFFLFFNDFALPYMYANNVPAWFAFKQTWKDIFNNKVEILVYWLARLVCSIGVVVIAGILFILLIIVFVIAGGIIFLIGFLSFKIIGLPILFIAIGILFAIALIIIFGISILMLTLPLNVFYRYFHLFNFENLTSIKLLK